jgi:hypothetical protein
MLTIIFKEIFYQKMVLKEIVWIKDNFIYYLKELEFRYNFRDDTDDSFYKCLGGAD